MRSKSIVAILLAALATAAMAEERQAPPKLVTAFFTDSFLGAVAELTAARRVEAERLERTYLQETAELVWSRTDNGSDVDWHQAEAYCRELELGGWRDWRLPTLAELESLHDRRSTATYKLPSGFRLTACCPWSSTLSSDGSAWNFSYRFRRPFSGSVNYSFELRALCVRAAAPADLEFFAAAAAAAAAEEKKRRGKS